MNKRKLLFWYKLVFGLLGLSSILTEIVVLVHRGTFHILNFFSYFTIESNTIMFIVFLLSALAIVARTNQRLDFVRGAATVYILIVGVGFSALLSTLQGAEFTAVPWDNIILHYIIPAAALVDLIIDRPQRKLAFGPSLIWLVFPALYLIYTMIRGTMTGWYPYPFLDPTHSGYGPVLVTVGGIVVLAMVLTFVVSMISGKRRTRAR